MTVQVSAGFRREWDARLVAIGAERERIVAAVEAEALRLETVEAESATAHAINCVVAAGLRSKAIPIVRGERDE